MFLWILLGYLSGGQGSSSGASVLIQCRHLGAQVYQSEPCSAKGAFNRQTALQGALLSASQDNTLTKGGK